jgi:hypothetical protein
MTSSRKPTSQRRRSGLPLRGSWDRARIERTGEGVLTEVYRLRRREETLYLRVAEVAGESMAPETAVRIGRQAPSRSKSTRLVRFHYPGAGTGWIPGRDTFTGSARTRGPGDERNHLP